MTIQIGIIESNNIFRSGMSHIFDQIADIDILFSLEKSRDISKDFPHFAVPVLLVGIYSVSNIVAEIDQLRRAFSGQTAILFLLHLETQTAFSIAAEHGVRGIVSIRSGSQAVVDGIRALAQGRTFLDPALGGLLWSSLSETPVEQRLSKREFEVIRRAGCGETTKEIARHLNLSTKTIEKCRTNGMTKLNLRNRAALIRLAIARNWISDIS